MSFADNQYFVVIICYHDQSSISSCEDINECTEGTHNCNEPLRATCVNTPGSFVCQCNHGFYWNGVNCLKVSSTLLTV